MNKSIVIIAILGLAATASAAPVRDATQSTGVWAAASTQRMLSTKIMTVRPDGQFHGNDPVTRFELAVTLDRFIHYIEAGTKPLHVTRAPAVIPPHATGAVKQAYAFLTSQGFLPPDSPLITNPGNKAATARELGDAMGEITVRLSDRGLAPYQD